MLLGVNHLARAVEMSNPVSCDADVLERQLGSLHQVSVRCLEQPDAGTALFQLVRRPFEHSDIVTVVAKQTGGRQSSEAASDNGNLCRLHSAGEPCYLNLAD